VPTAADDDIVVDDGTQLQRVQCSARAQVDLRSIHSNSHGYMIKRVPSGAYDWLYILAEDGSEYLIRDCLHGRRSITLTPAYLLGAVAESG
jgi:hypothetical protein